MTMLKDTVSFPSPSGGIKTLGGLTEQAADDVKVLCLQKCGCWVKRSINVVRTEYLAFEILQSYKVFTIPGKHKEAEMRKDVEKLCKSVRPQPLPVEDTYTEIDSIRHIAEHDVSGDSIIAWPSAIIKWERAYKGFLAHARALAYRLNICRACTSKIEQTFSQLDRYFHKRRESLDEETLNTLAKLFLDTDPAGDHDLALAAQHVWIQHYGRPRQRSSCRIDKEIVRTKPKVDDAECSSMTKTDFVHARRRSAASVSEASSSDVQTLMSVVADADVAGWSDSHQKELDFQHAKRRRLKPEAFNAGRLVASEVDEALVVEASELAKTTRNNWEKAIQASKSQKSKVAMGGPQPSQRWKSLSVHVHSNLQNHPNLHASIARLSMSRKEVVSVDVGVSVVPDIAVLDPLVELVAKICGAAVLVPSVLVSGVGPIVTYEAALGVSRRIFLSDRYRVHHAAETALLDSAFALPTSKWQVLKTLVEFQTGKDKAINAHKTATVLGVFTDVELAACGGLPDNMKRHMFSTSGLLCFTQRLAISKCNLGANQV